MSNQKVWTKDEVESLTHLFYDIPLQQSKAKTPTKSELIQIKLKTFGYERSISSIRRKLFRLGLTDYTIQKEIKVKCKCFDCGTEIQVRKRYYDLYDEKNFRCNKCKEIYRRSWATTEKGKLYHSEYMKNWKKQKEK